MNGVVELDDVMDSFSLSPQTPEKKSNDQRTRKRKGDPYDNQGEFSIIVGMVI